MATTLVEATERYEAAQAVIAELNVKYPQTIEEFIASLVNSTPREGQAEFDVAVAELNAADQDVEDTRVRIRKEYIAANPQILDRNDPRFIATLQRKGYYV